MEVEFSGAEVVAQKFADLEHHASVQEDILEVAAWGMRVRMVLENFDQKVSRTSVTYRAITYIDRLTHPVVDYAIGWGDSLADANEMAAETYMSSVFPVIHSICCEKECAYGVENFPLYGPDSESGIVRDWRLVRGPQVMVNATPQEIPPETFASILDDEFPQLVTRPGTYWFKCFVGRFGDEVQADCFLNNAEHDQGKSRLLDYGRSLPAQDIMTCKQHLLIYPLEPGSLDEYREQRQAEWRRPLAEWPEPFNPDDMESVLAGLHAFHDFDGLPEGVIHEELGQRGISVETATKLLSFLPAACARDFWEPEGITFLDQYTLFNYESRRSTNHALSADPIYRTCLGIIRAWKAAGVGQSLLESILAFSAENNAIRSGLDQGCQPEDMTMKFLVVPWDEAIDGEIDEELLKALGIRTKPWWKFW